MIYRYSIFVFLVNFIFSCNQKQVDEAKVQVVHGIDVSMMDTTANPANGFYRFANGNWLDNTEIPGDVGRWTGFNELRKSTNKALLALLDRYAKSGMKEGSDEKKRLITIP